MRLALFLLLLTATAEAEVLTVPVLLERQGQWDAWSKAKKQIQVTGRYRSRIGDELHLQKLDLSFVPQRGMQFPKRLHAGTRLTIFGRISTGGKRPEFRMSRCNVGRPDEDSFQQEFSLISVDKASARYALVDRYHQTAEFYGDSKLEHVLQQGRATTFAQQRSEAGNDPVALWKLIDPGPGFAIDDHLKLHIQFQVMVLRSQKESPGQVLDDLRMYLPGWNQTTASISPKIARAFETEPVAAWGREQEAGQRQLERLLYRQVRLQEITKGVKTDGSNGLELAAVLRKELPEEVETIRDLESGWADHELQSVATLPKRRLEALITLLAEHQRDDDIRSGVDTWLEQQIRRFRDSGLEGEVRVGEEHFYAFERWKQPKHREQGIEWFKKSWQTARKVSPDDAEEIGQRLERLGWTRMHDRWMTLEEVRQLPATDIGRAAREGKVVAGMSPAQVRKIHGEPDRRVRIASSRHVEEVWTYGKRGNSRLAVFLRRARLATLDSARVINVYQER